ncbi:conserved hypothetical protein [Coccidioides posadasii str. Silveira]|uniref:Mediator of RNA polymerase II transcription subunit 22 n=1 Tax=Coccidioides posadasii (strain RMSCC 757 / Silveira) TaxID=443226 RepID=E9DD58_COCPS|nr:conserved hypothetical protein [Coccidioides posadasii str. Silveira]
MQKYIIPNNGKTAQSPEYSSPSIGLKMDPQQPTSKAFQNRINADIAQLLQRFENIMAAATVRAVEDILALTRTMKELWLFGKLDMLGEDERDVRRREQLDKDVEMVKKAIDERLLKFLSQSLSRI